MKKKNGASAALDTVDNNILLGRLEYWVSLAQLLNGLT